MATLTVTASTDDTMLNVNARAATWASIIGTNDCDTVSTNTDTTMVLKVARDAAATYTDSRMMLYFDTSALPDSAQILSGSLHLHQTDHVSNGHGSYISPFYIVRGTFPTGVLAVGDWDLIDTSHVYGSQTVGAGAQDYNVTLVPYELNISTNINRAGNSFFVVMVNADYTATTPSESASATDTTCTFSSANNATAADRPQLTLVYQLPDTAHNFI